MADTTFKTVIEKAIEGFNDIQDLINANSGQLTAVSGRDESGTVTNVASIDAIKGALVTATFSTSPANDNRAISQFDPALSVAGTNISTTSSSDYYVTASTTARQSSKTVTVSTTRAGLVSNNTNVGSATITASSKGDSKKLYITPAGVSLTQNTTYATTPTLTHNSEDAGTVAPSSSPTTSNSGLPSYYIKLTATAPQTQVAITKNISEGYLKAASQFTGIANATVTGKAQAYYIPLTSAAAETQSVAGSDAIVTAGLTKVANSTDSGITIQSKFTSVSRRGKITTAGWIPKDNMPGANDGTLTGASYGITNFSIAAGKTLAGIEVSGSTSSSRGGTITNLSVGGSSNSYAGGQITTLASNGTISAYQGTGGITTYTNTGTIGTMTGSRTLTNLGSSSAAGTLNITTNTYGTVNVWGTGGDKQVQVVGHTVKVDGTTVTNTNGDLIPAELVAQTGYIGGTTSGYITTTNTGFGGFYGYGNVKTNQAGWIASTNKNSNNSSTYYIVGGVAKNGYVTTAGWIPKDTSVYTLTYDSTEQCVDFVFNN